ncbi:MAG: hypothetical protein IT168_32845 [Bryobacterales bacterium]|nr:hypothetical protein [Bryobacterales bacterium]
MESLGFWLLAFIIQPADLPPAIAGKEYSGGPLTATENTCGQQNVIWSVPKGQLPPGLNLSPAGFVSGLVNLPGEWRFTVRAQSGCTTFDQPYTLHVLPSPLFDIRPGSISLEAPLGPYGESRFDIRVGSNQAGLPYTIETSGQSWFRARARENMIPAAGRALTADLIEVMVDTSRLPPGRHKGWIKLSAWRAMAPVVIPIEARVVAPAPVPSVVPITSHLEPVPIPVVREPIMTRVAPPPIVYIPPAVDQTHRAVSPPPGSQSKPPHSAFRMRRFAAARPKLTPKPPEPKPAEPKKAPDKKVPDKPAPEKASVHPPTPTVKPSPVGPPKSTQPPGKPKPDPHPKDEKKPAAAAQQQPKPGTAPPPAKEAAKPTTAHAPAKPEAPHKTPAAAKH